MKNEWCMYRKNRYFVDIYVYVCVCMGVCIWGDLIMKRTLNSVCATTTFLCSQSLLVPRKWNGFLSCFFLSLPPSFSRSTTSLVLITAVPQSTPLSSVSVWESIFEERKRERAWSMASIVPGPVKVDCGKIRLGKRLVHRRLGRTCSPLL